MLKGVDKLVLIDINEKGMESAKEYIEKEFSFKKVEKIRFDNTLAFVDEVILIFDEYEKGNITEKNLFEKLRQIRQPSIDNIPTNFDFITQLGIMDYYLMPIFSKYCEKFRHNYIEFYTLLQHLNSEAVKISLRILHRMLEEDGVLILSTPITRIPEGDECKRSLFWIHSIEKYINQCDFEIKTKTYHIWEEFPEKNGHSHRILNVACNKRK